MKHENQSGTGGWFGTRRSVVLLLFLAIVGFFLFTEHRAHLFGILPYFLLLACPFMHFFMHGGHGKHGSGSRGHH
ncbi:MAG TPA: DUF2933 domain-containing protein [Pyrinomonadaceae bacterium]|nr:DUF2933 domain-containing protein [Pyrinomonadaceae bacterium]